MERRDELRPNLGPILDRQPLATHRWGRPFVYHYLDCPLTSVAMDSPGTWTTATLTPSTPLDRGPGSRRYRLVGVNMWFQPMTTPHPLQEQSVGFREALFQNVLDFLQTSPQAGSLFAQTGLLSTAHTPTRMETVRKFWQSRLSRRIVGLVSTAKRPPQSPSVNVTCVLGFVVWLKGISIAYCQLSMTQQITFWPWFKKGNSEFRQWIVIEQLFSTHLGSVAAVIFLWTWSCMIC